MSKKSKYVEWGQAKGYSDYIVSTDGQVFSLKRDIILSQYYNGIGKTYLRVKMYNDSGERKNVYVHRLVYMVHKGEIPEGMQINHKDENKTNNNIENLEVLTPKENTNYGTANKRRSKTLIKAWKRNYAH